MDGGGEFSVVESCMYIAKLMLYLYIIFVGWCLQCHMLRLFWHIYLMSKVVFCGAHLVDVGEFIQLEIIDVLSNPYLFYTLL